MRKQWIKYHVFLPLKMFLQLLNLEQVLKHDYKKGGEKEARLWLQNMCHWIFPPNINMWTLFFLKAYVSQVLTCNIVSPWFWNTTQHITHISQRLFLVHYCHLVSLHNHCCSCFMAYKHSIEVAHQKNEYILYIFQIIRLGLF